MASIRQYQIEGRSDVHLCLYSWDGTLKKQLTHSVGCDDISPLFSDDGTSISFHRKGTLKSTAKLSGLYRLDLASGEMARIQEEENYVSVPVEELLPSFAYRDGSWNPSEKNESRSWDGRFYITLKPLPPPSPEVVPPVQHLLSVGGNSPIDVSTLPGFPPEDAQHRYDEHLLKTRFAPPLSAFYGAAIFHDKYEMLQIDVGN